MPSRCAQVLAQLVVAHDPAAHAVADQDDVPAHRLAEDEVVEGGDAVQLVGGHAQAARATSRDGLVGHPAAVPLHDLQRLDAGGPLASAYVRELAPRSRVVSSSRQHALDPLVYRSTSASTKSMLPRIAIRSGIMQPAADAAAPSACAGTTACGCACGTSMRAAVADQVVAVVALGRLDADERLARRDHRPPAHAQEVVMSVSMSCIVRSLRGGVASGWSDLYGPAGMFSRHCSMMRRLWRISSTRTTARS